MYRKKRIAIVTWFGGSNYGTSLQAFALNFIIQKLGADSYLLQKPLTWRNVARLMLITLNTNKRTDILKGFHPAKKRKIAKFRKQNFNQLPQRIGFIGKKLFQKDISTISGVIAGSDQIWNPYYTEPFLLLQNVNSKKFSYASSVGVMEIPEAKKPFYEETLKQFMAISSREESSIPVLEALSGKSVKKVSDPTFLLTTEEWEKFAADNSLVNFDVKTPYILSYFVAGNPDYWEKTYALQELSGIKRLVVLPMDASHFNVKGEIVENAGINDFIYLIKNATLVCTDSFHATAISINLKRDFVTLLRFEKIVKSSQNSRSQNSRLEDLLAHYCLLDRLYDGFYINNPSPINYSDVDKLLNEDRLSSMDYLNMILRMC